MDVGDSLVLPTSEDVNSFHESLTDAPDSSEGELRSLPVNDLGSCLTEYLKIQNDQDTERGTTRAPGDCDDCHGTNTGGPSCKKCLKKSATFPVSNKSGVATGLSSVKGKRGVAPTNDVSMQNGHSSSVNPPHLQHAVSLPTSLKLVSAMKGSREKQGKPTEKLSVTWAPDVYDPTPTSVSHVPSNKPHRRRSESKKSGKNKQKASGKSSRSSSKGKDKKKSARKSGCHSNRYNSLPDDNMVVVCSGKLVTGIANYDLSSSPEPFSSESSFLINSQEMCPTVALPSC